MDIIYNIHTSYNGLWILSNSTRSIIFYNVISTGRSSQVPANPKHRSFRRRSSTSVRSTSKGGTCMTQTDMALIGSNRYQSVKVNGTKHSHKSHIITCSYIYIYTYIYMYIYIYIYMISVLVCKIHHILGLIYYPTSVCIVLFVAPGPASGLSTDGSQASRALLPSPEPPGYGGLVSGNLTWLWINTYENTIFRGMNIHKIYQLF